MLIKFSEQIANTFAKKINGYKGELKTLTNVWDGAFSASCNWLQRQTQNLAKTLRSKINNQKLKDVHYFAKTSILDV